MAAAWVPLVGYFLLTNLSFGQQSTFSSTSPARKACPRSLRCSACGGEKEPRCKSKYKSNIVTQLALPQMGGKRKSTGDFEESEDAKRLREEPEVTVKVTKSVGKFKFTSFRTINQSEIKSDENSQTIQNTKVVTQNGNT